MLKHEAGPSHPQGGAKSGHHPKEPDSPQHVGCGASWLSLCKVRSGSTLGAIPRGPARAPRTLRPLSAHDRSFGPQLDTRPSLVYGMVGLRAAKALQDGPG